MTAQGFDALHTWIGKQGVEQTHACLEATGEYGAALGRRWRLASMQPGTSSASSIRRASRPMPRVGWRAPRQTRLMRR
jgi:hypothetical protein